MYKIYHLRPRNSAISFVPRVVVDRDDVFMQIGDKLVIIYIVF